jgi:uncharacterized integral membrane protein
VSAAKTYGDYTAEEVAREEQRKASIEARGLAVVTTSGALATLLLALAALNKDNRTATGSFFLPHDAQGPLKWALIFFTVAALGAVLTNFPVWLQYLDPDTVVTELAAASRTEAQAEKHVAENRVVILRSLQTWNSVKGWVLFGAMSFEFLAILFIAIAVRRAL